MDLIDKYLNWQYHQPLASFIVLWLVIVGAVATIVLLSYR